MSARNLERAGDFQEDVLRERRIEFYRYVRERTEEWLRESRVRASQLRIFRS